MLLQNVQRPIVRIASRVGADVFYAKLCHDSVIVIVTCTKLCAKKHAVLLLCIGNSRLSNLARIFSICFAR